MLQGSMMTTMTMEGSRPLRSFPQADDLQRVFAIVDAIKSGSNTWESIGTYLERQERIAFNYIHGARWLGLIESAGVASAYAYSLTPLGQRYADAGEDERFALRREIVFASPAIQRLAAYFHMTPEQLRTEVLLGSEIPGRRSDSHNHVSDQGIPIERLTEAMDAIGGTTGETSRRRAYGIRAWLRAV